jgi:ribosomal subunit interface protein
MHIQISGQHMSVGSSLQEYVNERISSIVKKYFAKAQGGHVHFSKRDREFGCDIVINEGTGRHMVIKSNCSSNEVYNAFDNALTKLEKQLRRYKSKLTAMHNNHVKPSEITAEAVKYVISPDPAGEEESSLDNPAIIAEKPVPILSLSIGEAVMKMDLENLPALLFENAKTKRVNVVYYRKDGNISWVDTK